MITKWNSRLTLIESVMQSLLTNTYKIYKIKIKISMKHINVSQL